MVRFVWCYPIFGFLIILKEFINLLLYQMGNGARIVRVKIYLFLVTFHPAKIISIIKNRVLKR